MRKQFRDAAEISPAIRPPAGAAVAAADSALRASPPSLLRQRHRLVCAHDDSGQLTLHVYDRALGRSLLSWRGAVARALLETTGLRMQPGETTHAPCGKETVRRLMLEAASYAAQARTGTRGTD